MVMLRRQATPGVMDPKELVKTALDFITEHPERWEQDVWGETPATASLEEPCGTVACLAGWMAYVDGMVPMELESGNRSWTYVTGQGAGALECGAWALERLGLTSDDERLFASDNTIEALRAGVEAYLRDASVYEAVVEVMDDEDDEDDAPASRPWSVL